MMIPGMGGPGGEMDFDMQGMLEKLLPRQVSRRAVTVAEAREVLFEQECDKLIDEDKGNGEAVALAEESGVIFLDEVDKVVASDGGKGNDVSRQGVQRDLLPIVEGTTVQTRYGYVRTDHILFVAAGAFHTTRPSDLMPELQGRFPIRVELQDLTQADFVRILKEPRGSLTKQYAALMATEGVTLEFVDSGVQRLAEIAYRVNEQTENIGARRLHTDMERLLDTISFEAADHSGQSYQINAGYVDEHLGALVEDEDLRRYIL